MFLRRKTHGKFRRVINYRTLPAILETISDKKILITRKMPGEIPTQNIVHIWVTRVRHPNAIEPANLHVIEQKVWNALLDNSGTVILDAFEYLLLENGPERTLRFVGKLRDIAILSNSDFYVTVSDGIDERILAMLKRIVE